MRDTLIIIAAVVAAIAALTTFLTASDDVTARQETLVGKGKERGAALQQASGEKKRLRWFLVGIPAVIAVGLNIGALAVAPAAPHACVDQPTEHSSPAVTPSRAAR